MFTMIDILLRVIIVIFCTTVVYFSGELMLYISDKYPDKEWINKIVAFIDLVILIFIVLLVLQILLIILPFVLLIVAIVTIIEIIIYGIIYIIKKIKNNL